MKTMKLGDRLIDFEKLKSRRELMEYFNENGSTHTALMEFCEEYRDAYGNELCWPYPISDGKHLGTFFVLVREGILSLPYDDADKVDYELFCMDDAVMFQDYADMDIFIDDWKLFHKDLLQAMTAMRDFLYRQEVQRDGRQ